MALFVVSASRVEAQEGPNLIPNSSVEETEGSGQPRGWLKGGFGNNTRFHLYPATPAHSGRTAMRVDITSIAQPNPGDAKWYFNEIPVTPGKTYTFSDWYLASTRSVITVQYRFNNGTLDWKDLARLDPTPVYKETRVTFTVPEGVVSLTIFHLISEVGSLTTDDFSLRELGAVPAPEGDNLIFNPGLEKKKGDNPKKWKRWSTYHSSETEFDYPLAGLVGKRAAGVRVFAPRAGEAGWKFREITGVAGKSFVFRDLFVSNAVTHVIVQYTLTSGIVLALEIGRSDPAFVPHRFVGGFVVPQNVQSLTVIHILRGPGTLVVDDFFLAEGAFAPPPPPPPANPATFATGLVSINFDDGHGLTTRNVLPILAQFGLKADFYVNSGRLGAAGFLTVEETRQLETMGHKVGNHGRHHQDLSTANESTIRQEILGGHQDLVALGLHPRTHAYAFGVYNDSIIAVTRETGVIGARATDGGTNLRNTDRFKLRRLNMGGSFTVDQAKAAIDRAIADKTWLVLLFHHVGDGTEGNFSVTLDFFREIVQYLTEKQGPQLRVITNEEGIALMQ